MVKDSKLTDITDEWSWLEIHQELFHPWPWTVAGVSKVPCKNEIVWNKRLSVDKSCVKVFLDLKCIDFFFWLPFELTSYLVYLIFARTHHGRKPSRGQGTWPPAPSSCPSPSSGRPRSGSGTRSGSPSSSLTTPGSRSWRSSHQKMILICISSNGCRQNPLLKVNVS